jgi:hypothetical protein
MTAAEWRADAAWLREQANAPFGPLDFTGRDARYARLAALCEREADACEAEALEVNGPYSEHRMEAWDVGGHTDRHYVYGTRAEVAAQLRATARALESTEVE